MPHPWFEVLAIVALAVALICLSIMLIDIVRGHPQRMPIMNYVWPITALYFGPLAVWAYLKLGRPMSRPVMRQMEGDEQRKSGDNQGQEAQREMKEQKQRMTERRPCWRAVVIAVTHCGAGCTLGDLIGEWAIFILGVTLVRQEYWPAILLDYALAYLFGIAFQYFSIAPMRGISGMQGIWAAMKADTLSLSAFEVGLFGWMALFMFVIFPHLEVDNPAYWFMMQIGMIVGFATSYPMNWWLLKRGIKEPM